MLIGHITFLVRYRYWMKTGKTELKRFEGIDDAQSFAEASTFARQKFKEGYVINVEEYYCSPYKELIGALHRELRRTW